MTSRKSPAFGSREADPGQLPSTGPRLAGIEGLRAVAAFSILVLHTWLIGSSGLGREGPAGDLFFNLGLGVTLFFTLSGFLLYRPFTAVIARADGTFDFGQYLRNRALRILPAYWVIFVICALVLQTALVRDGDGTLVGAAITDPGAFVRVAFFVQNYDPATLGFGLGPDWSLAIEVVFYLLLPLLVLAVAQLARRRQRRSQRVALLLVPPLLLLAVGLVGKFVAGHVVDGPVWSGFESTWHAVIERSFVAQADLFAFGMAAAVLHTEVVDKRVRLPGGWRPVALVVAGAVLALCVATLGEGQLTYKPQNTAVAFSTALALTVVAFPIETRRQFWLTRILEARPLVIAGLVSYSVFLWHEPVIRWLAERGLLADGWAGFAWNLSLTLVVVGALSWATYRLVELPALRHKHRVAGVGRGWIAPSSTRRRTPRRAWRLPRRGAATED